MWTPAAAFEAVSGRPSPPIGAPISSPERSATAEISSSLAAATSATEPPYEAPTSSIELQPLPGSSSTAGCHVGDEIVAAAARAV